MELKDPTSWCEIKGDLIIVDNLDSLTCGQYKISIRWWENRLKFLATDELRCADDACEKLESAYKQVWEELDFAIKRFGKFLDIDNEPYFEMVLLFIEFILKSNVTEIYNNIEEIIETSPDSELIDGIKWTDWYWHEVYYPGETKEQWEKRRQEQLESLQRIKGEDKESQ